MALYSFHPPRRVRAGLAALLPFLIGCFLLMPGLAAPHPVAAQAGTIYYVHAATGNDTNTGTSWGAAFATLPQALATASSGAEIWVAAGTYYPDEGGSATDNDRFATFQLISGVAIYGGFAGTETSRDQRDWQANPTILSGDIDQNDTPDFGNRAGNSYHVVTGSGTDTTAVLDGFTITAGNANGSVAGSIADRSGGGVYNDGGSPTLTNVTISGNEASRGGGIANFSSSNPTLINVTISGNQAGSGGGMYNFSSSNPVLTNVTISGNQAGSGGGMANITSSNPVLTNVTISGNLSDHGGGMINGGSSPTLINVIISGNGRSVNGGGIMNFSSNPTLINVTISGNQAGSGAGMYNSGSSPVIQNSIIWGNDRYRQVSDLDSTPSYTNTLVQGLGVGGFTGSEDPAFADLQTANSAPSIVGDYRLLPGSPLIDAGDTSLLPADSTDLDGDGDTSEPLPLDLLGTPRVVDGTVDLGAYEYTPVACPAGTVIFVNANASGSNDGSSWADAFTNLRDARLLGAFCPAVTEIWVAAGTYYPDEGGFTIDNDRFATFLLVNGLGFYGGFAGTETSRDQRDWQANRTILSGDIDQNDAPDFGNRDGNSYHVVTGSGTDGTAVLDGFIITAGNANERDGVEDMGGGVYNDGGSPTLINLVVQDNQATACGGGLRNHYGGSPTLTNVTISGNQAGHSGGGICYTGYWPVRTSLVLTNVTISGNQATRGGGIYNSNSWPVLTNVTIAGNQATNGGGIYNFSSSPTLTNVTIAGNQATNDGGGLYNINGSNPVFQNSIIWGNDAPTGPQVFNSRGTLSYASTLVQGLGVGGFTGSEDPAFAAPEPAGNAPTTAGDYRLLPGSPLIDAGDTSLLPADSTDLDGDGNTSEPLPLDLDGFWRVVDSNSDGTAIVDLGAYELLVCPTGATIFVDQNASGGNSGVTWASAFTTLQDALELAVSGSCPAVTEIWVAAGTYYPDEGRSAADNDRFATFQLISGVAIYGGFAGTETSRDQRDWQANPTILSGDIDQNDTPDFGNRDGNSYHVVTGSGTDTTAVLDGFTITAGNANGSGAEAAGGGIVTISSNPMLTNLVVQDNQATAGGGIVNDNGSNPTLTNVTITGNQARDGGGLWVTSGNPTLTNVTITGNQAGIGGGLGVTSGNPTLTNVTITGNRAGTGGGIFNDDGIMRLTTVTIASNRAGTGGGIFNDGSPLTIQNSIIWGNMARAGTQVFNSNTLTYASTLVQGLGVGGFTGSEDPAFAAPEPAGNAPTTAGDYRLLPGSVVINAGDNSLLPADSTDLDGNPRLVDGIIDLGAYEAPAFTLTEASGNNQRTLPGTAFSNPLVVSVAVSDAATYPDYPLEGGSVTFVGPDTGASTDPPMVSVAIDGSNQASASVRANSTAGSYTVSASTFGNANTVDFRLTNVTGVVSITRADSSPTNADSLAFTVVFSDSVSGVDTGNFALSTTDTVTGTIASVSGSGTTWTVTVESITGNGDLGLDMVNDTGMTPGVDGLPVTTGETYTVDNTAPTVAIGTPSTTLTESGPVDFPITITDADSVTLTADDVTLNATGDVTGTVVVSDGTTDTPTVTVENLTGDGTVTISIAAGVAADSVGNTSAAAGPSASVTVDNPPPPVDPVDVRPVLECVVDNGNGSYTARFGYLNENAEPVTIPIGDDNKFTPTPQDRGQPTEFQPGRIVEAFAVDFDGSNLVWTLQGRTSTASRTSQACAPEAGPDTLRLQFLNGRGNKFVAYGEERQLLTESCPVALEASPALLDVSASGGDACHFGGRQRLGVRSAGERGGGTDSITSGEELTLALGADVGSRLANAVDLRIDARNGATVTVAFYAGDRLVGAQTIAASGGGSSTQTYTADAGGAGFDRIVLGAESGTYGLKGFRDAVVFRFTNS